MLEQLQAIIAVSIHARHATGDLWESAVGVSIVVSIHARHATGDIPANFEVTNGVVFQFTPDMRRATTFLFF